MRSGGMGSAFPRDGQALCNFDAGGAKGLPQIKPDISEMAKLVGAVLID
jgi:hypothetical protein